MEVIEPRRPLRLCLLIGSLEFGGAERQVVEMARNFDRNSVVPVICTLSDKIPLVENDPETLKIVTTIRKHGRFDFTVVARLAAYLRRNRIDVVHAFLFDCEIAARLAAPLAGWPVVIASERNADYVRPRLHQWAQRITSPLFDVMVANSTAGARFNMRTLGLDKSRFRVVYNGVDTHRFQPDCDAGNRFRSKFGFGPEVQVIGMVGSFKRQKDHGTFLRMAAKVLESQPQCRFIIAGDVVSDNPDSEGYAAEIQALALDLKIADRCLFIGNQLDVVSFYNACDFTVLLSRREGTPNVALESMACGKPVIVTDISDNSLIIPNGKTGYVVPPGAWNEAASHSLDLLSNPELLRQMGQNAREHVCHEFTPSKAAKKLAGIYRECHAKRALNNTGGSRNVIAENKGQW